MDIGEMFVRKLRSLGTHVAFSAANGDTGHRYINKK